MWFLLALLVIVVGGAFLAVATGTAPSRPQPPRREPETVDELLARDPSQALARYGTSADAERLIAEGRGDELRGLGWDGDGGRE